MHKNNRMQELKRWLKSSLKNKVSINDRTIITYLMTGLFFTSQLAFSNIDYVKVQGSGGSTSATGIRSIAIGKDVRVSKTETIAIGSSIQADVLEYAVLIGHDIKTLDKREKNQGIAIGKKITTTDQAIAIGGDLEASGRSSIALGGDDTDLYKEAINYNKGGINYTTNRYAQTKAIGDSSIAIGTGSLGYNKASTALGVRARSFGEYSTALGANSQAETTSSIALGRDSVADRESGVRGLMLGPSGTVNNTSDNKEWKSTLGALSIGNSTNTRQITGVAAGSEDTDAVNVAQLKKISFKYYSINSEVEGNNSNKANDGATANNAIAIGPNASSSGKSSIVIGTTDDTNAKKSYANDTNSVVIGVGSFTKTSNSSVAIGYGSEIEGGEESVAIGKEAKISASSGIALGSGAKVTADASSGIAVGKLSEVSAESTIAIGSSSKALKAGAVAFGETANASEENSIALGRLSTASQARAIALGYNSKGKGITSIAIGSEVSATGENSLAIGTQSQSIETDTVAIGNNARANKATSIALGSDSVADEGAATNSGYDILTGNNSTISNATWRATKGVLSVGDTNKTRKIVNVAAGRDDTDAVNVAQLKQIKLRYKSQNNKAVATSTKESEIKDGFLFKSISNELKISAKDNGEVEFKVELPEIEKGNLLVSDGIEFTTANAGNNRLIGSGDVTLKLSSDVTNKLNKIENGRVEAGNQNLVSGDSVYNAITAARTKVDLKQNESILEIEKTEPTGISPNNYKLGINLDNLKTNLGNTFSKNDLSNITNSGKDVIKGLIDITNGENTTVSSKEENGVKTFTINAVDKSAKIELDGNNSGLVLTPIAEAKEGNTLISNYKLKLSDDIKNNINSGKAAKDFIDANGITFKADDSNTLIKKLSETLDITATGTNIGASTTIENSKLKIKVDASDLNRRITENNTALGTLGNNSLKFGAETGDLYERKNSEDATIKVISGSVSADTSGDNLATKMDGSNIVVGLKKDLTLDSITVKGKAGKDAVLSVDDNGNLTVINGKDGKDANVPEATKIVTESSIGNMELSYKASDETDAKKTTLGQGLHFKATGDNLTVKTDENGIVTYELNVANDISTGNTPSNKLVTENAIRNYVSNQLDAEKTRYVSIKGNNNDKTNNLSNFNNDGATGVSSIAIGRYTKAADDYSIALGTGAHSNKLDAIALGNYSFANGKGSIAMGISSQTLADNTLALGTLSKANVEGAVALGTGSLANKDRNILGLRFDSVNNDDTLLEALETKARYDELQAEITQKTAEYEAIKQEIAELEQNGMEVDPAKQEEHDRKERELLELVSTHKKLTSTWRSTLGAVSVGNSETGDTRQITNVAAGTEDTDAVNVAQLKHLADREFIFTDGENDNNFVRKNSDHKKIITIKSADIENTTFKGQNLKVSLNKDDGTFVIGLKEDPEFKNIKLKDGNNVVNFIPSDANTLKLTGSDSKDTVKLTNLTNGDITENSKDAINGSQLFDLKKELGLVPEENPTPSTGPSGKDGLDGKSIVEKADALRDGLAGNQIYTTPEGNRVVKEGDKYYEVDPTTGKKAEPEKEVLKENLVISNVNPDGSTSNPISIGNVASGLGLDGKDGTDGSTGNTSNPDAIKPEKAKDVINNLLEKSGRDLNKVATVADLQALAQAGLEFEANVGKDGTKENNITHRPLSSKLTIIGKEGVDSFEVYSTDNIATKVDKENGKIEIGILEKPKFKELKLGEDKDNTISLTPNNDKLTLSKDPAVNKDNKVIIDGLKDGESPDSAVTKGTLDKIVNDLGSSKDDILDGRNGETDPKGAAGNDNLNGVNANYKINALRRGEAGIVVYTDEDGNRVAKAKDGKFYLKENVSPAGDLMSSNYVLIDGKYYLKEDIDENGKLKDGKEEIPEEARETAKAEIDAITSKDENLVIHSLVNANGDTKVASILANVKSSLGLIGDDLITDDNAIKAISGDDRKSGLLTQTTNLERAATIRDLQAAAIAGLTFYGDNKTDDKIHRKLGQELQITGSEVQPKTFAENNISVKKDADDILRIKLAKNITNVDTISGGDTKAKITLTEADKITIGAGENNTEITLDGVADGKIEENSNEAINGSQLLDLAKQLGIATKDNKKEFNEFSLTNKLKDVAGMDIENPKNMKDMLDNVVAKINEGYKFGADQVSKDADLVHRMGSKISLDTSKTLTGKAGDKANKTFVGDNLLTEYEYKDGNAVISIGFKDRPEFKDLTLKDDKNTVKFVTGNDNTLKLTGENDTDKIKLTNLQDGNIAKDSTDAITGNQLYNLREELGLEKDPSKPAETSEGAAGKDGLDGKSILDKVKALRDGTAGNTVYTTPEGERVVRGEDGKLYKESELADKVYDPTTKKYYPKDNDGNPNTNETAATPLTDEEKEKVIISAVNPDGSTSDPISLGNIASGLGLDGKNKDGEGSISEPKAIEADKAKDAITNLLTKEGKDLNKVATIGDLQALAQAGLDFSANSGKDIHRPLGSKINIVGNSENATDENIVKFTDKNVVTMTITENDKNDISIRFAERPEFKGIDVIDETKPNDKLKIDPTGTEIIGKDDEKFVKTTTSKDGILVTKTDNEDGTNNNNNPVSESAKFGLDGITVRKDEKVVNVTPDSISIKDTSVDDVSKASELKLTKDEISISNEDDEKTVTIKGAEGDDASKIILTDKNGENPVIIDGKGSITGLEDRNSQANPDYGQGDNKQRAATEGALRELTDRLGLTKPEDEEPEDSKGTAKEDKLDNTSVLNKINAIRNGQAGPVVYTDKLGNRLVRDADGKFYPLSEKGLPDKSSEGLNPSDVILSAVNTDGTTIEPTTLGNIKSAFADDTELVEKFKENAKNLVEDLPYYKINNQASDAEKLADNNKVVNKEDLVNMAILGLNFDGNKGQGEEIHRSLGTKLSIKGEGTDDVNEFNSASGNILVESDRAKNTLIVKLSDSLSNLKNITFKNDDDGNPEGLITGLKDLDENSSGSSAANKNYVDSKFDEAKKGIDVATSGVANAVAMSNLTQVQHRGGYRHQVSAGYGMYNGEHAFGVGLSGISKGGQVIYKASGSLNTRGNFAAGVGIGYQFDKDEEMIERTTVEKILKEKSETDRKLEDKIKALESKLEKLSNLENKVEKEIINKESFKERLYIIDNYINDKYELTEVQMSKLKAIITEINEKYSDRIIDITGYTDMAGNENYNLDLGLRRANLIEELMIKNGLKNPQNIRKVSSFGYNNRVNEETVSNSRISSNRRVEILVK